MIFLSGLLWYMLIGLAISVSLDMGDHKWFEHVMSESNPRYYKIMPGLVYICMYAVSTVIWPLVLFCWITDKWDEKRRK